MTKHWKQTTQAKSLEFACLFVSWLLICWFCLICSYCFDCGFCGILSFLILFSCCFCLGLLLLFDTAVCCTLRISQEAHLPEKQPNDSCYPWCHLRGRLPRCTLRLCWEGNTGRFQNTIDFLINLSERFQIKVRWNRSWNHRAKENQWKTRGNGRWVTCAAIGGPSSSCEMIILWSNSHGRIIKGSYGNIYDGYRLPRHQGDSPPANSPPRNDLATNVPATKRSLLATNHQ